MRQFWTSGTTVKCTDIGHSTAQDYDLYQDSQSPGDEPRPRRIPRFLLTTASFDSRDMEYGESDMFA